MVEEDLDHLQHLLATPFGPGSELGESGVVRVVLISRKRAQTNKKDENQDDTQGKRYLRSPGILLYVYTRYITYCLTWKEYDKGMYYLTDIPGGAQVFLSCFVLLYYTGRV